jgi:hypothetical protein
MALPPDQWWPPDFLPSAPAAPPPQPTDELAANPDEPWWPSDWVVPEVAMDLGAPEDASAPALPVDPDGGVPAPDSPYGAGEAPVPPPPTGTVPGSPEGAGPVPVGAGAGANPTVAPGSDGLFPWSAPGALAGVQQTTGGLTDADLGEQEPVDYEFSPEEAEAAELESALAAPDAAERLAESGVRSAIKSEQHLATRRLEEETKNLEWAERNATAWRSRMAELDTERQGVRRQMAELSKTGPDNKRWYKQATTVQQIGAWVAGITGGILSPYRGGKNTGIDFVMDLVNKDIESQKFELEQRGQLLTQDMGILGQLVAETGDVLRAEEALRLASFANIDQRLAAEAVKVDPAGTQFQRIAEARLIARNKAKEAAAIAEQKAFDRKKDQHAMSMQEAQLAETRRGRQASAAQQQRSLDASMLKDGFVRDPKAPGGYRFDPSVLPQQGVDPQTRLAGLRGDEKQIDIEHKKLARSVQFGEKVIGEARSETESQQMRDRVANYLAHQEEMTELVSMVTNPDGTVKKFYQGPGWSSVPNEERDAIMAKAFNVLYTQAKINDPTTGVKDFELQMTGKMLPFVQGLISGRSPAQAAKAVLEQSDSMMEKQIDSKIVGGLKNVPEGANPVAEWKKTRGAVEGVRKRGAGAQTPQQSEQVLTAKLAAGTPPEAVKEFVKQKVAVLERWAADDPQRFEGRNVEALRAQWAADPTLTTEDKATLNKALNASLRKVWGKAASPFGTGRRPIVTNRLPPRPDDDDLAEELE